MNQTLICQHNGHRWERPAQRGRKPRFCPKHLQATVVAPAAKPSDDNDNAETLICQHGNHKWQRVRTRGRKPPLCPEHRVTVQVETPEGTKAQSVSVPSAKIRTNAIQTGLEWDLNGAQYGVNPKLVLQDKLRYTVRELENIAPWREQADINLSLDTHKRLAVEAAKV